MPFAAFASLTLAVLVAMPDALVVAPTEVGQDSFGYRLDIGKDELRGPAPARSPSWIKREVQPLLQGPREDGQGLKPTTGANIESFLTADGVPVQLKAVRQFERDLRGQASPGR